MSKILTAYFSAGGKTAKAASKLASKLGADLYEIMPTENHAIAPINHAITPIIQAITLHHTPHRF